jgi:hypothetical protein
LSAKSNVNVKAGTPAGLSGRLGEAEGHPRKSAKAEAIEIILRGVAAG